MGHSPSEVGSSKPKTPKLLSNSTNSKAFFGEKDVEKEKSPAVENSGHVNQSDPPDGCERQNKPVENSALSSRSAQAEEKMKTDEPAVDSTITVVLSSQDAAVVNAISKNSVRLNDDLHNELKILIDELPRNGKLTAVFGFLIRLLKCPQCGGELKRLVGKPGEYLVCASHQKIDKFALASQLPREILVKYLAILDETHKQEWIDKFTIKKSDSVEEEVGIGKTNENFLNEKPLRITKDKEVSPKEKEQERNVTTSEKETSSIGTKEDLESQVETVNQQVRRISKLEMLANGKPFEEVLYLLVQTVGQIADRLGIFDSQNARKEMVTSRPKLEEMKEDEAKPYLNAANKGKAVQDSLLSRRDIQKLCAYSYTEKKVDRYYTIHIRGIRRTRYEDVWKLFASAGINYRKVAWLTFVDYDILEVDLLESYVKDFITIVEFIHKRDDFKDLVIKRIEFEPLDPLNIKNNNDNNKDPVAAFETRMQMKINSIERMIEKAPYLNRLLKYVKLQKEKKTFDIPLYKPLEYEETASAIVEKQLTTAIQKDKEAKSEVENDSKNPTIILKNESTQELKGPIAENQQPINQLAKSSVVVSSEAPVVTETKSLVDNSMNWDRNQNEMPAQTSMMKNCQLLLNKNNEVARLEQDSVSNE